ncbi:ABC-type amino acid transport substrate-binding protein [Bifidobacterium commune]|uniref:transporter substrate-binding domain-containing protein n=1 Tax=Bifidobacterium commune TaxID=1505727 RepID=UPI001605FC53|nr:transporter substrate-binding domain-containing protein [Bifidobacterium commune]MBB2954766.1 ABC-type amino acid transport substrate-binding protein [Bifidobacterium commune]
MTQTPTSADVPQGPTIAIAVTNDVPGLGFEHEGKYSGFDIEVARYVAQKLGYAEKQIVFKPVSTASVVQTLEDSKADLYVSIRPSLTATTAGRQLGVSNAYLIDPLALLVPKRLQDEFTDSSSLDNRKICTVKGTSDANYFASHVPGVQVEQRDTYPQCLTALLSGAVDAVGADAAVLAGLASGVVERSVTVLGDQSASDSLAAFVAGIAQVPHVVMVRQSDGELTKKIDNILRDMAEDGTWSQAVETMRKDVGYSFDESLNVTMRRH